MENILYQLFTGDYDITPQRDKKQQELYDRIFAELDKVEKFLGADFLDHLVGLGIDFERQQNFQYYRSGFLLALRLMLEVLGTTSG